MESLRKRTGKKFTALLLSALMVFTLLPPMTAQAEGSSAIWDGTADISWYNESESIFEISTAEQLAGFAQLVNSGTSFYQKTIKLTQNIVLNDTSDWESWATSPPVNEWTAIGTDANPFYVGAFDGQGFEISGIYINNSLDGEGLFGDVFGGQIKDVGVVKSYIKANNYVGGVVGHNQGMIIDCYNAGDVSGYHYVGGVAGYNKNAHILRCYNTGDVSGTEDVGGVAGYFADQLGAASIGGCYNDGYVSGTKYVGGVAGYNANAVISSCYNTGVVSGTGSYQWYIGGVVGHSQGTDPDPLNTTYIVRGIITTCHNDGYVSGYHYVGGVVGNNEDGATITNCWNKGDVSGIDDVGGVVGKNNNATITNCSNDGYVSGHDEGFGSCVGGVAARSYTNATITNCYNSGDVSGKTVGGVVGLNFGTGTTITNCYNTGDVSGTYIGGVVGTNDNATITNCYNTGDVSETGSYVGGVAARNLNNATITNCYYLESTASSGIHEGYGDVTSKTEGEFKNGTVAYLLQGDETDLIWGHTTLDGTEYPCSPVHCAGVRKVIIITFIDNESNYNESKYALAGTIDNFPSLSKIGHSLSWVDANNIVDETTEFYDDTTITAVWTPIEYSITYNLNGGKNHAENPDKYTYGEPITLQNPTRTGFTFAGWYLDEDFDTEWNDNTEVADGITLYAKWTANPAGTAPTITTTSLPNGTVGTAYIQTLAVDGDTPITWSLDSGSLPTGLALSGDGVVSGTPTAAGTFNFTVKAENSAGSDTKALSITINPAPVPPSITAQPTNQTVTAGETATFTVTATGDAPLSYQWKKDGVALSDGGNIGGAATATLTISNARASDAGSYTVVVTNAAGSVTSDAATLTVNMAPPANSPPMAKNPVPTQSVTAGGTATFTASDIAEDADSDPLTITAIVTPPASGTATASLNGGTIAISGVAAGSTSIVVTVSDGVDTVYITVPVAVAAAPPITYTVSFDSRGGSSVARITGVAAGSVITAPSAPTRTGYTFGGWYKEASCVNAWNFSVDTVTANITLYAKWTYNGGGSTGTPAATTYKATVSGTNISETKLPVSVNTNTDSAATDLGALAKDIFTGTGTAVLTVPAIPGVNSYTVGIPAASLSGSQGEGVLTFSTGEGSVTLPSGMLAGIPGTEEKTAGITISQGDKSGLPEEVKAAVGDRPIVQLTLTLDGKQTDWSNPDAPVTVSIPYTPTAAELADPESIVVWYIDGSSNVVTIPNGHYDPATGMVTFFTTHFSDYAVVYNPVGFNDVKSGAWYYRAVSFIAARDITNGTGGGNFSPDAHLTRADFLVMLMKAYNIAPDAGPADNFSDAGDTYYTGYLAAAKRLGISAGTGGNMYAPGKGITRQEMFTLLYNVLKVIGKLPRGDSGRTLSDFSDAGQIDSWAKEALTLLVKTGTVGGSGGKLNPTGTTTRAEMAQLLYNLLGR